ncbi:hypothetical protein [Pelagicoccus sp. SDUM812003]|uniref:hypothetical protein n=1 Tax=Pelagicoccus sp. SDUM812003 TaxID=3041267 RepID=UPI00280D68DD|nr:hypothetical protein [Pelagicoccus sp. SDUM812003]MDQ8205328.1 hypothetical protein [Pelagicoccus sp. SDUM812003]
MGSSYIEKRIVKAGIDLCKRRIDQKGTPITADDLRSLKVRTISPPLQWFYVVIGLAFTVFGIWTHTELRNMAISFTPVLVGCFNIGYAIHGRPKKVSQMESEVDLMELSADIVSRFVAEMDAKRARKS